MSRWNGTHLRFVTPLSFPPFLTRTYDQDGRIRLRGMYGALMSNLTQAMGMTYEVMSPSDGEYGQSDPDPEKFTGMLRSLHLDEADIAVPGFFADVNIFDNFRYTPFAIEASTVIWTGMRHAFETSPTPYLKAFDAQTWMMIGLSMLVLTMIHTLEGAVLRQERLKIKVIGENFLRVFQSLLQEASMNRYSGTDRLLGGAWMLTTYVLMQYFSGDLKANSVMQTPTLRIRTAEDLFKHRKTHKLMYPARAPVEADLRAFKPPLAEKMRIVLEGGIPLRVEQYFAPENLKVLVEGRGVLSGEEYGTRFAISQLCQTTDRFFYMSSQGFPRHQGAMVMAAHLDKNLTDDINRRILNIYSMGVPFVSWRDLEPGGMNCLVSDKNSILAFDTLRFADLTYTFTSHFVSLTGCIAVFAAEIIFYSYRSRSSA